MKFDYSLRGIVPTIVWAAEASEWPKNEIDGPVALIMAMGLVLTKDNSRSPYERLRPNGFLFV